MLKSARENVRVVCRVRPQNQKELSTVNSTTCVKLSEENLEINVDDALHTFQFDRVFGPESNQYGVFEYTAIPLIQDVLSGYNATIFAYGQTGTGKTHTMEGNIHDQHNKGIIPRVVEALFEAVSEADESIEFTFKVTYVEIYMEKIKDLLDETGLKVNLTIREDKLKGIYVAGVTEEYVTSHEELLDIMSSGALNRATAATGMNEGSSRSHSVFTVTVNQKDTRNGVIKSGKLVLVDLAGSEMVRKSNSQGQQLEEAKTINKSLSALGQVIFALTDEKQTHVLL
jgi:kinesin family protein 5